MKRNYYNSPATFTVAGRGAFPIDMLRHDVATPADPEAVEGRVAVGGSPWVDEAHPRPSQKIHSKTQAGQAAAGRAKENDTAKSHDLFAGAVRPGILAQERHVNASHLKIASCS